MTRVSLATFALGAALASLAWWPAYLTARDRAAEQAASVATVQATYARDVSRAQSEASSCRTLADDYRARIEQGENAVRMCRDYVRENKVGAKWPAK